MEIDDDMLWALYSVLHATVHMDTADADSLHFLLISQEEVLAAMEDLVTPRASRQPPGGAASTPPPS